MGSTKLDFGGPFTTKKGVYFSPSGLFSLTRAHKTLHIPRASENLPLEKSQKIQGKTTSKKLMKGPSPFASTLPLPQAFQFLSDFSHFQTLPLPLIFPRSVFFQHSICKRGGKDPGHHTQAQCWFSPGPGRKDGPERKDLFEPRQQVESKILKRLQVFPTMPNAWPWPV